MIRVRAEVGALLRRVDVNGVRAALQAAIELEHATIPPYLYALYSLDTRQAMGADGTAGGGTAGPGGATAVAGIIRSVVAEEMLHMTLAANILNAIGGHPVLDSPTLLPRYPGPLPGTVEGDLVVGLAPFSVALVRDTFMPIEQPERPIGFGEAGRGDAAGRAVRADAADGGPLTIGQFYRRIRAIIGALGDRAFTGPQHHQVTGELLPNAIAVTGVGTAQEAIDTIIEQGEGTASTPSEVVGTELAHYYRFAEIAIGRRLVRNPGAGPAAPPDERWIYAGAPVIVSPAAIFKVPVNPVAADYPAGSPARQACDDFNYTYTSLLKSLHATFNGHPDDFKPSIDIMMSLRQQAQDMMSGTSTEGIPTGPTFVWQPVDP